MNVLSGSGDSLSESYMANWSAVTTLSTGPNVEGSALSERRRRERAVDCELLFFEELIVDRN